MPTRQRSTTSHHRSQPDPMARRVGDRIRALRAEQNFDFDAFVEDSKLGRGYISELQRGLVVPTIHALAKLAKSLEVTVADLVLGDTPREKLFAAMRHLDPQDMARVADLVNSAARNATPE